VLCVCHRISFSLSVTQMTAAATGRCKMQVKMVQGWILMDETAGVDRLNNDRHGQ